MKKFILFVMLMLIPSVVFADNSVRHSSKEANFSVEMQSSWDKMTVNKTKQGRSPAWRIDFSSSAATEQIPFSMLAVDGRKDEDIKQTSADFKNGQAEVIMVQLVATYKDMGGKDGFAMTENEIKQFGKKSFIWIKTENVANKTVRYLILTAFDNYVYSINCQVEVKTFADQQNAVQNLELMMKTLGSYKK